MNKVLLEFGGREIVPMWKIRDDFMKKAAEWNLRGWVRFLQIEMQVKLFQSLGTNKGSIGQSTFRGWSL